jgi:putative DNA primase/helicase
MPSTPAQERRPKLVASRDGQDVWQQVLGRLRDSGAVTTHQFFDWFAQTQLIADCGDQIIVASPGDEERIKYLQRHFKAKILTALCEVDRPGTTIAFRVSSEAASAIDGVTLQRLSDVKAESVDWLWPGRVAAGKITLVVGDPGLGKSWVALDVAARVTAGSLWPDRAAGPAVKGNVLLLDAENGLADTIRPRIDALRGDARRITIMPRIVRLADNERGISLADLDVFRTAIVRIRARVLIVDPLTAYLGATDSHREAEVRALLGGLQQLAEATNCAVLGVMHRAKGAPRDAVLSAIGSVAFAAAARVVLLVARDPELPGRRVLGPVKTNMASPPAALAYRLSDAGLRWERDPVAAFDPERLLVADNTEDRMEREDAEQIIRRLLKKSTVIDARVAMAEAAACCIGPRHMRRAATQKFGLRSRRVGGAGDAGKWVWELPRNPPQKRLF